jgi:hypothetical protein
VQDQCHYTSYTAVCKHGSGDGEGPAGSSRGRAQQHGAGWGLLKWSQSQGPLKVANVGRAGDVVRDGFTAPREVIKERKFSDGGDVLCQLAIAVHCITAGRCRHHQSGALFPDFFPPREELDGSFEEFRRDDGRIAGREFREFVGPAGIFGEGDSTGVEFCGDGSPA